MKKAGFWILAATLALSLCACRTKNDPSTQFEPKPLTGIDAIFNDSLGYNNENPSVMQDGNIRYVYYTGNSQKYGTLADTVYVRKGQLEKGKWSYSDGKSVLSVGEKSWDSARVYAPSVIKGDFTYNGVMYRYLMAYSGSSVKNTVNNSQIGFAVSNSPDGGFVKVNNRPVVKFDVYDWDPSGMAVVKGASEPSLVSYDLSDKVWLFYSFYSPIVSETERVLELDLSGDLKNIASYDVLDGLMLNTSGIMDANLVPNLIGSDFAYDEESDTLYAVRDYYPLSSTQPFTAESVQLVKGSAERAVYEIPSLENKTEIWQSVGGRVSYFNTGIPGDDTRFAGYERIYSAAIVRDGFGRLLSKESMEIIFTSCAVPETFEQFAYSTQLHSFLFELE